MSAIAVQRAFVYRPTRSRRPTLTVRTAAAVVRPAAATDVQDIHSLIEEHATAGRLLHRSASDIAAHIDRFIVATVSGRVVGCVDLAALSGSVAEVRSLVVSASARSNGIGRRLLAALIDRARQGGFARLAAFTHSPAYFIQSGFSIVPHAWVPEKVARDCQACAQFRRCGQYAVMLPLTALDHQQVVPNGPVHG